jgi:hypothetical protein
VNRIQLLIKDFCALVNLPDSEYVYRGGPIAIDNTVFLMAHDPGADPERLFLQADYGPPPAEREATVYYELLKRNFQMAAGGSGTFTISPSTGHVVFVGQIDAQRDTPEDLAQTLAGLANEAREWRQTRFLMSLEPPA